MSSLGRRQGIAVLGGALLPLLLLAACSQERDGEVARVDGYELRIITDPDPLLVGEDASLSLILRRADGQPASACKVGFRQSMPGMEMPGDALFSPMAEQGKGRYQGRSAPFTMGGDWALTFRFACGDATHEFTMRRHLAWRE